MLELGIVVHLSNMTFKPSLLQFVLRVAIIYINVLQSNIGAMINLTYINLQFSAFMLIFQHSVLSGNILYNYMNQYILHYYRLQGIIGVTLFYLDYCPWKKIGTRSTNRMRARDRDLTIACR